MEKIIERMTLRNRKSEHAQLLFPLFVRGENVIYQTLFDDGRESGSFFYSFFSVHACALGAD